MSNKKQFWSGSTANSASDVDFAITIPPRPGKTIVVRYIRTIGAHATTCFIRLFGWGDKGKTTTNTATADNAGDLQLAGDTGLNDTLNGTVYAAADYVLVKLDTRRFLDALGDWQFMEIASVGGATSGTVDLATLAASDGETDPQGAVTSGNPAYLALAEDVWKLAVGTSAATIGGSDNAVIFSGKPGHPVTLAMEASASVAHSMEITAEYV